MVVRLKEDLNTGKPLQFEVKRLFFDDILDQFQNARESRTITAWSTQMKRDMWQTEIIVIYQSGRERHINIYFVGKNPMAFTVDSREYTRIPTDAEDVYYGTLEISYLLADIYAMQRAMELGRARE